MPPSSRPKRILHLIHGAHWSGGEQSLYLLLQYLDRTRFEPTLVCLADGLLRTRVEALGIPVEVVPMKGKADLGVALAVARIADRVRPDLMVTQTARTNLVGRVARLLCGVPILTIVQAPISRDTNAEAPSRVNATVERLTSFLTTRYVAVSRAAADDLRQLGVRGAKIGVIYNSFDPVLLERAPYPRVLRAELGIAEDAPLIGMVASFRPRKGAEYLIDAMAHVVEKAPEALLVLVGHGDWVGDGDYLEVLRRRARERGVEERVRTLGFRSDIPEVLSSLSIKVLPSLFGEGSSLVLMEAMALGVPVIAADTEGNNEVVEHERSGLLVPARAGRPLADAILRLLHDPEQAARLAAAGRERAREMFAADAMARRYAEEYQALLGDGGEDR